MMRGLVTSGLLLKAAAFVVFLGVLGGATYGLQTILGDDATKAFAVQVEAPRGVLNATPGHSVTFPLIVRNNGDLAQTVTLNATGGAEGATSKAIVPAASNVTFFLTVDVPADAPAGNLGVDVSVVDATGKVLRERADLVTVRVLAPAKGFGEGDTAQVRYTGRLAASGFIFDTNDPFVNVLSFPSTADYQPHGSQPLPVEHDVPGVIEGFLEGLEGMQAGESRTITFPAEKGYGPATQPQSVDREETLERVFDLDLKTDAVSRDVFDNYVSSTKQGNGSDFEVGEVFRFEQGPNQWPYRIVTLDDEKVEYVLDVKIGEAYTLYPFWEGASKVESVNETTARFLTTPTDEVGEAFTMRSYWPDMSSIVNLTDESVVVRHSPPVGFKFTQPGGQTQPSREAVVQEVTDDSIIVGVKSDNPLAGQALTFDVEILAITR